LRLPIAKSQRIKLAIRFAAQSIVVAAFLIFCRTSEIAPGHFEARVFVVPAGEDEAALAVRSECRIFESAELAATECLRMAEAMKGRLAGWGHEVEGPRVLQTPHAQEPSGPLFFETRRTPLGEAP